MTRPTTYVWPTIRAREARQLIDDLVDHCQLAWPRGRGLMVGSARDGDNDCHVTPGSTGTYVVANRVDAFERTVPAGATVVRAPNHTNCGSREFTVRDIEGNWWSFGTYAGA
jgi:uncharacterized glyoxalase superfamily protein PhnB